jgi:transcriptional regulator GlxA family with amidase domain
MAPYFQPLISLIPLLLTLIPSTHSTLATLPFHIGVLIVPPIQLLDIGPIDLFAMSTQSYFNASVVSPNTTANAIPDSQFSISYISHTGPNSTSGTTADLGLQIDAALEDPAVAPGNLSLLMIPGPPPGRQPPENVLEFVRAHVEQGVDLVTICSGLWVAAYAGVLDGKEATLTTSEGAIPDMLRSTFPDVSWVDRRYGVDKSGTAELWTSGMFAYLTFAFPLSVVGTLTNSFLKLGLRMGWIWRVFICGRSSRL